MSEKKGSQSRNRRPVRRSAQPTNRLRRQPKMRRVQSTTTVPMPQTAPIPRTARRRRRRNNQRVRIPTMALRRILLSARWISLGLFLLTAYGLVLTGLDLHFYLTYIPVAGSLSVPPEEIVDASGLAGAHIFAADPNDAARRIDQLPGIISATVTLNWPNQVWVEIAEDSPVAVWQELDGEQFWITADGRLIPARLEALGLPVIESEFALQASIGDAVAVVEEGGVDETAVSSMTPFVAEDILAGALQLQEIKPEIQTFSYRPATGLTFRDERGWLAHFGTGRDMEQKMSVYEAIVTQLQTQEQTPEYISVSHREKPYYRVR